MFRIILLLILLFSPRPAFCQSAYIDSTAVPEGTLKWKYTITDFSSIPPLMASDGTIYLSDIYLHEIPLYATFESTSIFAISPDGILKWKLKMGGRHLYKILAIDVNGTIYITQYPIDDIDDHHNLFSLNPDGTEDANYSFIVDSGAFGDNKYFTFKSTYSSTAYFYILKPDGNLTTIDISAGQPFIGIDGFVYFNGIEGIKRLISPENIEIISPHDSLGSYLKLLALGKENTLYIGGNTFRALKTDGTLLWEYPLTGLFDCIIDNNGIVYTSNNSKSEDYLYAINSDGTLKWRFREETADKQEIKSPCIGSNGIIYFINTINSESYVYALNPDGTFRWRFHTDNNIPDNFYLMLHKNGLLYVADSKGTLYAIQTSSYGYEKDAPWPCYGHDNGHTFNAGSVYTAVEKETEQQENTPNEFSLIRNYPNPFNSSTTISFNINKPGKVEISVYNLKGQKVATLSNSYLSSGYHLIVWNAEGCSSGLYFVQMKSGYKYSTLRAMLVK